MARATFSPQTLTTKVSMDGADVERSDKALDEMLARPLTRWDRVRVRLTRRSYLPPVVEGSSALGANEAVARNVGFVPLTWLVVDFWSGGRFGVECWLHPSGQLVLEVTHPIQGERGIGRGRRTLATYFADGTSVVMWHDDKYLDLLESPARVSLVSTGDLAKDVKVFRRRVAKMCKEGSEILAVWDVQSLHRRYEVYDRFMESEGTRRGHITAAKQYVIKFFSLQIPFVLLLAWAFTWPRALLAWVAVLAVRIVIARRVLEPRRKPSGGELVG